MTELRSEIADRISRYQRRLDSPGVKKTAMGILVARIEELDWVLVRLQEGDR